MTGFDLRRRLLRDDPGANRDAYLLDILGAVPGRGIDRLMAADVASYLPEDLLVKMDRATMAHSLEARSPLLDHRLAEWVAVQPTAAKVDGSTTKKLLREVALQLMPARLVDRPKLGFSAPLDAWFRDELSTVYRDVVLSPDARVADHLEQSTARNLLDEHLSGRTENGRRLWLILAFELWARQWSQPVREAAA